MDGMSVALPFCVYKALIEDKNFRGINRLMSLYQSVRHIDPVFQSSFKRKVS
jgi:hypothetical protein